MSASSYITPQTHIEISGRYEEKKSIFIAHLFHIETAQQAQEYINELHKRYYDAKHIVFAWRLKDGAAQASDDGEPQQTAGIPLMQMLEKEGICDCICAVVRYFGGTLLGVGGLKRAYLQALKQAYQKALSQNSFVCMRELVSFCIQLSYREYQFIPKICSQMDAHVITQDFQDDVYLELACDPDTEKRLLARIQEAFSRNLTIKNRRMSYLALS